MPRENFDDVWAEGGPASDPGDIKIDSGFAAGEHPPAQEQNWWQRRVDRMLQYFERHGLAEWDAATPYEADGLCLGSDGHVYQAVQSNQNENPVGSVVSPAWQTANWRRLFPPASTSRAGVIEIATDLETSIGAVSDRAVSPSALSARFASTSLHGLVELATLAETLLAGTGGADSSRAVTPAGLEGLIATTARRGIVELATVIETQALTDGVRVVTPQSLGSLFPVLTNGNGTSVHLPFGMVVQFGRRSGVGGNSHTVDFPESFGSTEYAFVAIPTNNVLLKQDSRSVSSIDISSGGSAIGGYDWIAIGTE